jgi:hypothetical protein
MSKLNRGQGFGKTLLPQSAHLLELRHESAPCLVAGSVPGKMIFRSALMTSFGEFYRRHFETATSPIIRPGQATGPVTAGAAAQQKKSKCLQNKIRRQRIERPFSSFDQQYPSAPSAASRFRIFHSNGGSGKGLMKP